MNRLEKLKQKFNKRLSFTKKTVSIITVVLFLLVYTLAMGCKNTPDATTIEHFDLNRLLSNAALLHKTIFNMSQLLSVLYVIVQVAVSFILIPLFIYTFFKTTTFVAYQMKKLSTVSKSIASRKFETTYIIQEKFLC